MRKRSATSFLYMRRKNSTRDKGNVSRKHGISLSTLSTFLKDRQKIKSINSDANGQQRKKFVLLTMKKWTRLYTCGFWTHN